MDAIAVLGGQGVLGSSAGVARRSKFAMNLCKFNLKSVAFGEKFGVANGFLKNCPSTFRIGQRRVGSKIWRSMIARASMDHPGSAAPIAPLQLESPIGQFLAQILQSHPHLLPAAVDQQLELLQTDRDEARKKEEPATSGTDLVLYRRIAEVKANERRKTLEEILYALVVQKFVDVNVPLIPSLSQSSDPTGKVDTWPPQEERLQKVHSPEAYEMIKNHLALILGNRLGDSSSVAQISKLRVGQVYMASVMYGYFLKRVDQRFQLEKSMKTLPYDIVDGNSSMKPEMPDNSGGNTWTQSQNLGSPWSQGASVGGGGDTRATNAGFGPGGFGFGTKPHLLRSYVMSFDAETLQQYATIRSKEAVSIIEKHTEALFGRPEYPRDNEAPKEEAIRISFAGLTTLVLEAVTFGSFLWDVESYVDLRYHFVTN